MKIRTSIAVPFYSSRLMAIGDSITQDTTSAGLEGYRGEVDALTPGLTWLGSVSSGGTSCEAWPGERIEQVSDRLVSAFTLVRDVGVAIVMLGTNNAAQGHDGPTAVAHYAAFLDRIVGLAPYTRKIILSTPNTQTGAGFGQATIDAINAALPGQCAARARCTFVDIRGDLDAGDYADTYHLVQSGYIAIAPTIAAAIAALT
jgi:lysophospholipase L1-like esterase